MTKQFLKAVIYFVKFPEPGKVKTRLAKTIGDEQAALVYRKLAEKNFKVILESLGKGISLFIFFDPADKEREIREWLSPDTLGKSTYFFFSQQGADLGQRMKNAFDTVFQKDYRRVMTVGSDILGLTSEILFEGFGVLEKKDAVIGPAADGGYYLIGLNALCPALFEDIPWSTGVVLEKTLERARNQKLSFEVLEELEDLDEIVDGTLHKINQI